MWHFIRIIVLYFLMASAKAAYDPVYDPTQFVDRQDLPPTSNGQSAIVGVGVGAVNLIANGVQYGANRYEIELLVARIKKLETLITSSCSTLNSVTSVANPPGTEAENALILTNLIAIGDPTCA